MPQPTLLPDTDLKKTYKFIWYIGCDTNVGTGIPLEVLPQFRTLMNHFSTSYVAQLAEKVSVPEDNLETQDYDMACTSVPVPKKFAMPDINVTYLEDTNDSVYNFHKSWMSFIRKGDTFCMEPLYPYSIQARYITYENTLDATEYMTLFQAQKGLDGLTSRVRLIDQLTHIEDIFKKPRSIYNYPHIFPVRISREEGDKTGTSIARVTVTYKRIPEIVKSENYINTAQKNFFVADTYESTRTRTII